MRQTDTGALITQLRKEQGLTQKQLVLYALSDFLIMIFSPD